MNLRNRDGAALPMAILVIAVLTAGLAAGFSATGAEISTNTATKSQIRAYEIAQAGLEQFLVRRGETGWCQNCAADPSAAAVTQETTRITFTHGYADIVATKVRPWIHDTIPAMYFIRSTGRDTATKLSGASSAIYAERTVGVYARWNSNPMEVTAAWVSLNGLTKNGTGLIDGNDQCGAKAALAGVQVPSGQLTVNGESFTVQGNPPADSNKSFTTLRSSMKIDWNAIINEGSISADYTIPGQTFPAASVFDADPDFWPIIRIRTNGFSLPNRGRGMIIADSNFTISGSNMWDGIVLVGGKLTSNGNNTTAGATLSGLNYLIGGTPPASTVDDSDANGQKTYVYNSCNVENATKGMRAYVVMSNTWMDNVASW
jgi:hypothetical protein